MTAGRDGVASDAGGRAAGRPGRGVVIAIDGPAGSGKSTTARGVAEALGFRYVDSGAFYRAAALLGLRAGLADPGAVDGAGIARLLGSAGLAGRPVGAGDATLLDGEQVGDALRSPEVTEAVGRVAAEPEVRRVVTRRLREAAAGGPVVMDGRDIGTVVFRDADLKIYLDATVEERARRRSAAEGRNVDAASLARRDDLDRTRAAAPLAAAPDAVVLACDDLAFAEQVERIVGLWRARPARP